MKKSFSISAVALTLIAGGYPIQQVETTYKTVEVGPATVEIERTGNQVSMWVEDVPNMGELSVSRGSLEISENSEGCLITNSTLGITPTLRGEPFFKYLTKDFNVCLNSRFSATTTPTSVEI